MSKIKLDKEIAKKKLEKENQDLIKNLQLEVKKKKSQVGEKDKDIIE